MTIAVQDWVPAGGLILEPNGLEVARERTRSVSLMAGPGSGKTEVLAQRCDFLLRTNTCPYPRRILAISAKRDARSNLADRVRERCGNVLADRLDSLTFHAFSKGLIDRFRPALTGHDALPSDYRVGPTRVANEQIRFSDMAPLAIKILQCCPAALRAVRLSYSHVLLDEFQDCTADQYEIICRAFLGTSTQLTAVGDTKQMIMRWAGAQDGIFSRFEKDFDALPRNLYQNRRSSLRLRRMQNAMVKDMDPGAAVDDEELQGTGGEVQLLTFSDEAEEAEELAALLSRWITTEKVEARRIAVLISRQSDLYAPELFRRLKAAGIPYRDEQAMQDLAKEPLFCLLNDFLRVLFGRREPTALTRFYGIVVGGDLSPSEEFRRNQHWTRFMSDLWAEVQGMSSENAVAAALSAFLAEVDSEALRAMSQEYQFGTYYEEILEQCLDNARRVASECPEVGDVVAGLDRDDSVKVLTIHKSKGLEYHSVVMLGVELETFWGKLRDERMAFFVGVSRAEERLVLTTTRRRSWPQDARRWDVSRRPHQAFLNYARLTE